MGIKAEPIPPHMLEGMTSAAQKKVLRDAARAESRVAKKSTPKRATSKAAAKKGTRPRAAKKSTATPVTETKE